MWRHTTLKWQHVLALMFTRIRAGSLICMRATFASALALARFIRVERVARSTRPHIFTLQELRKKSPIKILPVSWKSSEIWFLVLKVVSILQANEGRVILRRISATFIFTAQSASTKIHILWHLPCSRFIKALKYIRYGVNSPVTYFLFESTCDKPLAPRRLSYVYIDGWSPKQLFSVCNIADFGLFILWKTSQLHFLKTSLICLLYRQNILHFQAMKLATFSSEK